MPLDRDKLAKMLAMTTSDKDGEALSAIRMVNAMLTKEKVTWGEVLAQAPPAVRISISREAYEGDGEAWVPPHLKDKVLIDTMFRTLYSQPRTGNEDFWRWVDDVHQKFGQYGCLTQGQYTALRRCYQRATRTSA